MFVGAINATEDSFISDLTANNILTLRSGDPIANILFIDPQTTGNAIGTRSNGLRFFVNGADRMFINDTGKIGIGTLNPTDLLNVVGDTNISEDLIVGQHYISKGLSPSISSCGVSPTVVGTDTAGRISVGGVSATACTITFATAYASTPVCMAISDDNGYRLEITSISTTAFTIGCSGSCVSDELSYICIGL